MMRILHIHGDSQHCPDQWACTRVHLYSIKGGGGTEERCHRVMIDMYNQGQYPNDERVSL
jgi:hypothetical protein